MARADEPDVVDSAAARLLTRFTEQTAIRRHYAARVQSVNATLWWKTSAGERKASVFRGRWLS